MWALLLDPAMVGVFATALGTATYASYRSLEQEQTARKTRSLDVLTTVDSRDAMVFPLVASCTLLLLFYFFSTFYVVFLVTTCWSSVVAIAFCLHPVWQRLCVVFQIDGERGVVLPVVGRVPLAHILLGCSSVAIVCMWFFSGHFLLNNMLACALCITAVSFIRFPSIKVCGILLTLLFFYDIFWVFGSKPVFGKNVMVDVATQLELPVKLVFPRFFASGAAMLGLGDIALPSMLLAFALKFDVLNPSPGRTPSRYFAVSVSGYAVSLLLCFLIVCATRIPQPALLYIVPLTLGPLVLRGWSRGELGQLWQGIGSESEDPQHLEP